VSEALGDFAWEGMLNVHAVHSDSMGRCAHTHTHLSPRSLRCLCPFFACRMRLGIRSMGMLGSGAGSKGGGR